jgi:hypothetical protein
VTIVDGLVLARSTFHHSINYRSVVLFGTATEVTDPERKRDALARFVEHVVPGRTGHARPASTKEVKGTTVLELPIEEASVKVRRGGPVDEPEDHQLDVWAGVLPLVTRPADPVADGVLAPGGALPGQTTGGGLAYTHPGAFGAFLLVEAVRQVRGECGERQVPGAQTALAHGTGGVLSATSTVIIGTEAVL